MRERTTGVVQTRGCSESNCAEPKARARELELEPKWLRRNLLKADARTTGKVVKVEFAGERGVTVDKTYAYTQTKDQLTGQFVSVYADLRLP